MRTKQSTGSERRDQKRARVEIDVDLGTYERYYLTKLENVSIGGAFLRTRELHPVGTEVNVRFQLPDDDAPIETKGTVIWAYTQPGNREPNSSGMGIQFTDITDADRQKIALFIASQTHG